MTRRFFTLDVFTETALAGNPLAVVLEAEGLDDACMQAIAAEFNLSETVFVLEPRIPSIQPASGSSRPRASCPSRAIRRSEPRRCSRMSARPMRWLRRT